MKHIWETIPILSILITIAGAISTVSRNHNNSIVNSNVSNFVLQNNSVGNWWLILFLASIVICIASYVYDFLEHSDQYSLVGTLSLIILGASILLIVFIGI